MRTTRRAFVTGLGALFVGTLVLPETDLFVPRRKIWVVGAKLETPSLCEPPIPLAWPPLTHEQIVTEYLATTETRLKLAVAMIMPLRRQLDYQAICRKVFQVEQLPDGATPIWTSV
jgi:hypothetical protein